MPADERFIGTMRDAARFLNLSEQRISMMVKEGKITPLGSTPVMTFDLVAVVHAYLEQTKGGDAAASAKLDQIRADVDLKRAKAEKAQIELDEFKAIMHRSEDVEAITNDLVASVRGGILSLPGRLAVDLASLDTPRECSARVKRECNTLLEELSGYEYNPDEYKKRVRERERMRELEEEEESTAAKPKSRRSRKAKQDVQEES